MVGPRLVPWSPSSRLTALVAAVLLSCGAAAAAGPWSRTEAREPCTASDPLRRPLFGDLHVHTGLSHDAHLWSSRVEPHDAYAFARGGSVTIPDASGALTRTVRLERPLDFVAVTDHAEFLGEVQVCSTPSSPAFGDDLCVGLRERGDQMTEDIDFARWGLPLGLTDPAPHPLCDIPGTDCAGASLSVWTKIQADAEESYDRSSACSFTTFVGFENTASPLGSHLHRNVVFRNANVPAVPPSYLVTGHGGASQPLWDALDRDCLNAGTGCEAIVIPHNSNLSGGLRWPDPPDAADAARGRQYERLVEVFQHKASSECRFDRVAGLGTDTTDEQCAFEQDPRAKQGPFPRPAVDAYPRRNLVRNVLKDGLALEDRLGVNPFQFGLVGSTDTHNGTPGATEERNWSGHQGYSDATPVARISEEAFNASRMRFNPGGLAVVWAEENSRDALFAAMERRETYATSGTRPVVRLFAGRLDGVSCDRADAIERAYRDGVPMGGELGAVRGRESPRFLVMAAKDPGTASAPGANLDRIQIVKGWTDDTGAVHERVYDVAGGDGDGAVDAATCEPTGHGAAALCAVWQDPEFDPRERAFYYTRVLENPTCRWSTRICRDGGVDPLAPDCAARAAALGSPWEVCCLNATNDPSVTPIIQERAWTSPIWYRPDAIAELRGRLAQDRRGGRAALSLTMTLAQTPTDFDPAAQPIVLRVNDDRTILDVTVPAGAMRRTGPGRWVLRRAGGGSPLRQAAVRARKRGRVEAKFRARPDVARGDAEDHAVHVELDVGTYRAEHQRRWRARGGKLLLSSAPPAKRGY